MESRPIGFGSTDIEDVEKSEYESFKDRTMDTVKKTLRPELINRLDEIVVFHGLNKEHLRQITRLLGKELDKRLLELGIVVTCSDAALDFVTDHGYNPEYGARPLARAIMKLIEEPLSIYLLEDKIVANDTIQVDLENDKLVFFKEVNGQLIKID
jgi:ATP-dependent Clp protease ATP-binding subunit ClpA